MGGTVKQTGKQDGDQQEVVRSHIKKSGIHEMPDHKKSITEGTKKYAGQPSRLTVILSFIIILTASAMAAAS